MFGLCLTWFHFMVYVHHFPDLNLGQCLSLFVLKFKNGNPSHSESGESGSDKESAFVTNTSEWSEDHRETLVWLKWTFLCSSLHFLCTSWHFTPMSPCRFPFLEILFFSSNQAQMSQNVMEFYLFHQSCYWRQEWVRRVWGTQWRYLSLFKEYWINLQNIQAAHTAQDQNNQKPNQKLDRRPKQTFLQRRDTDDW